MSHSKDLDNCPLLLQSIDGEPSSLGKFVFHSCKFVNLSLRTFTETCTLQNKFVWVSLFVWNLRRPSNWNELNFWKCHEQICAHHTLLRETLMFIWMTLIINNAKHWTKYSYYSAWYETEQIVIFMLSSCWLDRWLGNVSRSPSYSHEQGLWVEFGCSGRILRLCYKIPLKTVESIFMPYTLVYFLKATCKF